MDRLIRDIHFLKDGEEVYVIRNVEGTIKITGDSIESYDAKSNTKIIIMLPYLRGVSIKID